MLEYTNLGSQILKTIDIVNSSKNITDDKEKVIKEITKEYFDEQNSKLREITF